MDKGNVSSAFGIKAIDVRFFVYKDDIELEDGSTGDIVEVNEEEFLDYEGEMEYKRCSVFDNGVKQICLTKYN